MGELCHNSYQSQSSGMIFKKVSLVSAKWLKYMLLKLQKYNLQVQYKKGAEMHTAYFLSRTFTDNNNRKKQQQQDASTSQADGMDTLAIEGMECKLEL